jgi:hypothetical protein
VLHRPALLANRPRASARRAGPFRCQLTVARPSINALLAPFVPFERWWRASSMPRFRVGFRSGRPAL